MVYLVYTHHGVPGLYPPWSSLLYMPPMVLPAVHATHGPQGAVSHGPQGAVSHGPQGYSRVVTVIPGL